MSNGKLQVRSASARLSAGLPGVQISLRSEDPRYPGVYAFATGEDGNAEPLTLPAPDKGYSLQPDSTVQPYSTWTLQAEKEGYAPLTLAGVQVFEGQTTLAQLQMTPLDTVRTASEQAITVDIPPHPLFVGGGGSGPAPVEYSPFVLDQVVIPQKITVHLGRPAASAQNVTVSFQEYIANVASSEVYPTWPEQALRANIHAQISLALNRVYTEWYPSKGYSFNITNSTSYDQYYVHGRTVFDVMERLTADIFNTYVRKTGTRNPYYTEYCDGKQVSCKGMKQWGTVDRANEGMNALAILRYYYGNDIEIIRTSNIASIPQSYPGSPLRRGDSGAAVRTIQRQLSRIVQDYPGMGKITVDGVFGADTEAVVKAFQKQFSLTADGVVGRATWYKISYIYVSVKDLAELTSEGETIEGEVNGGAWGGTVLREGSTGASVQQVQFWLNTLAQFDSSLPSLTVDGKYGPATTAAVKAFQSANGLLADGVVGEKTWNKLFAAYSQVEDDMNAGGPGRYPGTPLRRGDRGSNVQLVQFYMRIAATNYSALTSPSVDGIFGAGTETAVKKFQSYFGLTADGVVGERTWNKLYEVYTDVANKLLSPNLRPGDFPGTLRQGSSGQAVRELQYYLFILSAYYAAIPAIAIDGEFGPATTAAVKAFQQLMGLTVDGIVGQATWNKLYAQFTQLRTSGPVVTADLLSWPGQLFQVGSQGQYVSYITFLLAYAAYFYPQVQSPGITDVYTEAVANGIRSFQTLFGLEVDGITGPQTWNALTVVFLSLMAREPINPTALPTPRPDQTLDYGSTGPAVLQLQVWLNQLAREYQSALFLAEDGVYGPATRAAVLAFQQAAGLPETGFVDAVTWLAIRQQANLDNEEGAAWQES